MGKYEKFWSGSVSFTATETFKDLNAAAEVSVPSAAAKIVMDAKTITYDFNRIKEVDPNANTLPTSGAKNPDKKEREKVSKPKDNETSK
mgnify:CR=1 FL=1|tara:strand:- start:587 stop:853 length:267 start_codon:yes stop_codon:yes gene_type:complete